MAGLTREAHVDEDLEGARALDSVSVKVSHGGSEGVVDRAQVGADGGSGGAIDAADLNTVDDAARVLGDDGRSIDARVASVRVDKGDLDPSVQQLGRAVSDRGQSGRLASDGTEGVVGGSQVAGLASREVKGEVRVHVGVPRVDATGPADLVPEVAGHVLGGTREGEEVVVLLGDVGGRGDEPVAAVVVRSTHVAHLGNLLLGGALGGGRAAELGVLGDNSAGAVHAAGAGAAAASGSRSSGDGRDSRGRESGGSGGRVIEEIVNSASSGVGNGGGGVVVAGLSPGDDIAVDGGDDQVTVGTLVVVVVAVVLRVGRDTDGAQEEHGGGEAGHCIGFDLEERIVGWLFVNECLISRRESLVFWRDWQCDTKVKSKREEREQTEGAR